MSPGEKGAGTLSPPGAKTGNMGVPVFPLGGAHHRGKYSTRLIHSSGLLAIAQSSRSATARPMVTSSGAIKMIPAKGID